MKKLTIIITLLSATIAFAASGHSGEHAPSMFSLDFLFRLINFLILFGGIGYALSKPLKKFLKERSEKIKNAIEEAKKAKEEAEKKARYYDEKLANLQAEIEALKAQYAKEAEEEKERIIKDFNEQIERFKERMVKSLEQEKLKVKEDVLNELANMAYAIAEEMVKKNFTPADQKRWVKDYIKMMEKIH